MMKITLPRSALFAALGQVRAVVERRNTIPILSNALLDADASGLTLRATDLDIEIRARIEGRAAAPGATTVPAQMLFDIVRKFPDKAEVSLAMAADGQTLRVESGRARLDLQALPASDYPDITIGPMSHGFALPAATLARLIAKTEFAISTEETRYYLNGIYWHAPVVDGRQRLRAVATDGHRMALAETEPPAGCDGMPGIIVPTKAVARLREIAKAWDGELAVEVSDTKIRVTAGATVMTSKLVDGTFPDYTRVIPRGHDKRLVIDGPSLAAALDRVSTIASERGRAVKLRAEAERLTLTVLDQNAGTAEEGLDARFDGPDGFTIGFNSRYMADILETLDAKEAEIALGDPGSPTLFRNPQDESVELVLMPMRV